MSPRFEELDSLRGLAALTVFFYHIYLVFNTNIISSILFEYGFLRIMVAGTEAVNLFFVLSGFVLSLPFYYNKIFSYKSYIIKRFCRIYIPYITSILLALIAKSLFYSGNISSLSNWFNANWAHSLQTDALIHHLLLISTFTSTLNGVVWSLVHEMRISLIFPIMMFIIIRFSFKKSVVLIIGLFFISLMFSSLSKNVYQGTEWYATIQITSAFLIGALLAKHRKYITNKISTFNTRSKILILLFGLFFYLYGHPSFLLGRIFPSFDGFYVAFVDSIFSTTGSIILISFAISGTYFSGLLRNKIANFLGKISYSLYLIHVPILCLMIHILYDIIPMVAIICITIISTLLAASLMYHLVEKPSIKIGKFLTNLGKEESNAKKLKKVPA